jgi:hypothetical protein
LVDCGDRNVLDHIGLIFSAPYFFRPLLCPLCAQM